MKDDDDKDIKLCDEVKIRKEFEEKYINESNLAKDKYTRLYADFDNYKKRQNVKLSNSKFEFTKNTFIGLFDILDDIKRVEEGDISVGVSLIFAKISKFILDNGIETIGCDGKFNCDLHECITTINFEGKESGDIVDVISNGYILGGKVLKYAKVVVCN